MNISNIYQIKFKTFEHVTLFLVPKSFEFINFGVLQHFVTDPSALQFHCRLPSSGKQKWFPISKSREQHKFWSVMGSYNMYTYDIAGRVGKDRFWKSQWATLPKVKLLLYTRFYDSFRQSQLFYSFAKQNISESIFTLHF